MRYGYILSQIFSKDNFIELRQAQFIVKAQLTFTCSKSTIKTPEKDVRYVQS